MKTLRTALLAGVTLMALGTGFAQSGTASAQSISAGPRLSVSSVDCGPGNWIDTATGFCTVNLPPQ